jgi:serine/threonine-protein kinase RsbW
MMTDTRTFPHEPQSVPAARRFATSVLRDAGPDTLEAVELMVSELATNCIRHTDSGFDLTITRTGEDIRVEASDHAGGTPTMGSPGPTDPSGRGLKIIDMLASHWGVRADPPRGKTVWFTIADSARAAEATPA